MTSGIELSRRLERAEGHACRRFAESCRRARPESRAEWMECGGAIAVFNGARSPVTQTFGLGIFEELNAATLDRIERFFFDRGAPVVHEVSPFAGAAALDLLCARNYRPIEMSSVLYRSAGASGLPKKPDTLARVAGLGENALWIDVLARGWQQESFPDADAAASCEDSVRFIAELDGLPGAAGTLCMHKGVALFGGAATVPEMRRRGLQSALIEARMQYAFGNGCDVLMMVTEAGSDSQRNAERNGFRIAYTRIKWRLNLQIKPNED